MDDKETAYEEAGRAHRYFLNWRHAAFAGYFVVLYAVANVVIQLWEKSPIAAGVVLILAAPIGLAMHQIDKRVRELYYAAIQAAKAIEAGEKTDLYTRIDRRPRDQPKGEEGPHTQTLKWTYWFYSLVFLVAGVAFVVVGIC
jgi:hypothetical protein